MSPPPHLAVADDQPLHRPVPRWAANIPFLLHESDIPPRSVLRCHILLRWGATPLNAITALGVNKWISDLRQLGYANTTVATIVKVLSMILTDAADEGLISTNPIRRYRRRGRRSHRIERVWATPTEVLRIAEQAAALGGDTASLLIITAAWTGCRWGELTGLHRDNEFVFTAEGGTWLWRSTFIRRVLNPRSTATKSVRSRASARFPFGPD